jgi:MFS transporter, DHA2 family, multidrug resistance protein
MAATGQAPVIPPALFRVPGFTAGTFVPWIGQLAMIGLMFILPMYGQAIRNEDAMGSGLRLLPLIGGFTVAAIMGDRLAGWFGPKTTATAGYLIMAAGVFLGARMTINSSDLYMAVWLAIAGLGMGLGLVTAASVALRHVPAKTSNQASAVFQALQKTGGPLGAAILGSALSQAYQQHLALPANLPHNLVEIIRSGVFQGLAVADRLPLIRVTVRESFVTGVTTTLWICVGIAIIAAVASALLLPSRVDVPAEPEPDTDQQTVVANPSEPVDTPVA